MVLCCVNGCGKSSKTSGISFHAFPSNPAQRQQWLAAIGKPNWSPPNNARVCSAHFDPIDVFKAYDRVRIFKDAVPMAVLLTQTQACRICLATDVKLYSLDNPLLRTTYNKLMGYGEEIKKRVGDSNPEDVSIEERSMEGMPWFLCWECAGLAARSWRLAERARRAHDALVQIHDTYGRITTQLIKEEVNRSALNLTSSLSLSSNSSNRKIMQCVHNDPDNSLLLVVNPMLQKDLKENEQNPEEMSNNVGSYIDEIVTEEQLDDDENMYLFEEHLEDDLDIIDEMGSYVDISANETGILNKYLNDKVQLQNAAHDKTPIGSTEKESAFVHKRGTNMESTGDGLGINVYSGDVRVVSKPKKERFAVTPGLVYPRKCDLCDVMLSGHYVHTAHKREVHLKDLCYGDCKFCGKSFLDRYRLLKHESRHGEPTIQCTLCPKKFYERKQLKRHMMVHSGVRPYKCDQCDWTFTLKSSLKKHFMTHSNSTPYECNICKKKFKYTDLRLLHIRKKHPEVNYVRQIYRGRDDNSNTTSKTTSRITSKTTSKTTSKRSKKDYPITKCEHCEVRVGSRMEHWLHVRTMHPSEAAAYKGSYKAVCEICGKRSQSTASLRLHKLRHSAPTVPCTLCDKKLYDKDALRKHMDRHNGAKRFHCEFCGRGFYLKSNLIRHSRMHTGEEPFECHVCGKKFKYYDSRAMHVRSVHGNTPWRKSNSKKKGKVKKSDEIVNDPDK